MNSAGTQDPLRAPRIPCLRRLPRLIVFAAMILMLIIIVELLHSILRAPQNMLLFPCHIPLTPGQ